MTSPLQSPPEPAQEPGNGVPGAAARAVHFSQGGLRGGGGQVAVSAALIPLFLLYGAALSFGGFVLLGRFPWLPPALRATIVTGLFLVALWGLLRLAWRGYMRVMGALKLPMEMNPAADVNVICWPDQRDRMLGETPEPGTTGAFEPEVFRVWIARRVSLSRRMLDRRFRRRFLASVIAFPLLLQGAVQLSVHGLVAWEPMVAVAALAMVAPFAWAFVRPTYLRVAPGRVDVVRFSARGRVAAVEKHDLRARPIRLDLRRKELLIGGWHPSHAPADEEDEAEPDERAASMLWSSQNTKDPQASLGSPAQLRALEIVPLWGALDIAGLERAVFRAAVSSAEPGPMPDDALL